MELCRFSAANSTALTRGNKRTTLNTREDPCDRDKQRVYLDTGVKWKQHKSIFEFASSLLNLMALESRIRPENHEIQVIYRVLHECQFLANLDVTPFNQLEALEEAVSVLFNENCTRAYNSKHPLTYQEARQTLAEHLGTNIDRRLGVADQGNS